MMWQQSEDVGTHQRAVYSSNVHFAVEMDRDSSWNSAHIFRGVIIIHFCEIFGETEVIRVLRTALAIIFDAQKIFFHGWNVYKVKCLWSRHVDNGHHCGICARYMAHNVRCSSEATLVRIVALP